MKEVFSPPGVGTSVGSGVAGLQHQRRESLDGEFNVSQFCC